VGLPPADLLPGLDTLAQVPAAQLGDQPALFVLGKCAGDLALVLWQDTDADLHPHVSGCEGEIDAGCVTPDSFVQSDSPPPRLTIACQVKSKLLH